MIVQQSVKDVLQSLVDDGLVTVEKIGTSNYYWSFPSAVQQSKQAKLESLREELQRLEKANADLEATIKDVSGGREDSVSVNNVELCSMAHASIVHELTPRLACNQDHRRELMAQLVEAEALDADLQKELKQYSDSDPTLLEAQKKYSQVAKDAVNRWTENIFTFQSYCVGNFNIDRHEFNANFGIPDDLDTLP
ncbi:hypothetical protein BGZ70_008379 [Mortierella alpina]|uniref:Meiotic nuclear division protein 1 n=1 Tax=Mortierella alpina TaxID=64518 RepID=A0A9P6M0X1_MORAP|nr:hypothetical protein BGZ70_008379 [Mortierella alpina]